jgi:hypothetical protein
MIQSTNGKGTWLQQARTLPASARVMGLYLLAGRGAGKSRMLGRLIAMQDFLAGIPQVIFDPVGVGTIDNFLDKVARFLQQIPRSQHHTVWQRIRYVDMSGKNGYIIPFPLYYTLGSERSLLEIAERYLQVIIKSNPDLFRAQVLGWPPLHRIGVYTGMALASLGVQITEATSFLAHPEQWLSRLTHAKTHSPELAPVIAFFRDEYIPMRQAGRRQLTTPFLDKIFSFPLDPTLRAMFGATKPGINWSEVAQKGQTVLLDFRHEHNEEMRRFKMLWVFSYLYEWIKTRGRSEEPFGVIIDEFAHMTQQALSGKNPLATELDEFINVYMRQHTIWFSAAHQELYQIDEQLRNTLLSLGTYIIGSTSSMESARELADALFLRDPYWVKYYRPVFGRVLSYKPLEVIAEIPEFMPLEEQRELFAQRIKKLGLFQFLLRPALAEGHIGSAVMPLSIRTVDQDKETGKYQFPDPDLMARVRAVLAKQSGIPVAQLLKEQEARFPQPLPEQVGRLSPPQLVRHQAKRQTRANPAPPVATPETPQSVPQTPATLPADRQVQRRHRIS